MPLHGKRLLYILTLCIYEQVTAMLTHLSIRNLALAEHLELDLGPHMSAISGETGAGKSLLLDALSMALGDRCSGDLVRHGTVRAEVSAEFCLERLPEARQWLQQQDLEADGECILRRTLTTEGRSRAFINGQPVTLQQLRELGQRLVDIHGQHEHQSLLRRETHGQLVDDCAQLQDLARAVRETFQSLKRKHATLQDLQNRHREQEAQLQLLSYQVDELERLAVDEGEVESLEIEQQQLANAENIIVTLSTLQEHYLDGEAGCLSQLATAIHLLEDCQLDERTSQPIRGLLEESRIALQEAVREIGHSRDRVEISPERLQEVDQRLSAIYELARKHRVPAEQLCLRHQELREDLARLTHGDLNSETLQEEVAQLTREYDRLATELSERRAASAVFLEQAVRQQLKRIGLNPEFVVSCRHDAPDSANGRDHIEFLLSMNPGQPLRPLHKVASGGELSRISLCIQVVTASHAQTPTLVFDEVDVGIGGPTGEIVGRMLRQLGERTQILCVTHLAQVASQAHDHLFVSKSVAQGQTMSTVSSLQREERVREVARMLGGVDLSPQGLALANEMLSCNAIQ